MWHDMLQVQENIWRRGRGIQKSRTSFMDGLQIIMKETVIYLQWIIIKLNYATIDHVTWDLYNIKKHNDPSKRIKLTVSSKSQWLQWLTTSVLYYNFSFIFLRSFCACILYNIHLREQCILFLVKMQHALWYSTTETNFSF